MKVRMNILSRFSSPLGQNIPYLLKGVTPLNPLYKSVFLILFFGLFIIGVSPEAKTIHIQNEFIKAIVNEGPEDQGRFSIETTQGNPSTPEDDNQLLIYGRPTPWSSYTTIQIDGKNHMFGGPSKKTERRSGITANYGTVIMQKGFADELVTITKFDQIQVTQRLIFFRNPTTKVKDTVKLSYTVLNRDTVPHQVGVRVMLDTKLGSNDGAPFRIGDQEVTSEFRLEKTQLSDYWLTFDSLITPNVIAQGILHSPGTSVRAPDYLILSNWGTLVDHPWSVDYQKGRSFVRTGETEKDTALALYWDPVTIQPKDKKTVSTLYGLGELSLSPGELSVGLTAPKEIVLNSKHSFLVMGYVFNSGGFDAYDTTFQFKIPKGFTVVQGERTRTTPILKSGETLQIPIKLRVNGNAKPERQVIQFLSQSSTLENNKINRVINLVSPPQLSYQLSIVSVNESVDHRYYNVRLRLLNTSKHTIKNIHTKLQLPTDMRLIPIESTDKYVSKIYPNSHYDIQWRVKGVKQQMSQSIDVVVSATEKVHLSTKTDSFQPSFQWGMTASRDDIDINDYFFVKVATTPHFQLKEGYLRLTYDKERLKFLKLVSHPFLDQSLSIQHEPGKITLSNLVADPSFLWDHISKFYFQAIQPGVPNLDLSGLLGFSQFSEEGTANLKINIKEKERLDD